MMYVAERRSHERLDIVLPIEVRMRREEMVGEMMFEEAKTVNLSLGGVYFRTSFRKPIDVGEDVSVSVSIPRGKFRFFPFSRLVGRARVVRVEDLPGNALDPLAKQGIALEFSGDLISLLRGVQQFDGGDMA